MQAEDFKNSINKRIWFGSVSESIKENYKGSKTDFEEKGVSVSSMYDMECDYRYLYVGHNYLFYRIERDKIVIVEMFNDREDFMYKLFGVNTETQESTDYWEE